MEHKNCLKWVSVSTVTAQLLQQNKNLLWPIAHGQSPDFPSLLDLGYKSKLGAKHLNAFQFQEN